jgi:hypothetical protein
MFKSVTAVTTSMRLPETRDLFSRELTFPVTCEQVVETVGDVELDAPDGGAETVGDVLGRCEVDEFDSPDELYDSLISFVSDRYIGRKFYDDRGTARGEGEEVSF